MEPQTQPQAAPASTTGSQSQGQSSLDPQGVALAQSIRQTEGGNPTAKGASGEYGAYQWLPATWAEQSQAAGVNVPLDQSTLQEQNQVAYTQIEKWKNEGYNPGQIASLWNTGSDPNAYLGTFDDGQPSVGTNSDGVAYDVPKYADEVTSTYQNLKGQSNSPVPTANAASSPSDNTSSGSSQPSWLSALEGLGLGGLGWLAGEAATPLKDAATDAGIGATVGAVVGGGPEDLVTDAAGGVAGAVEGTVRGIASDIAGSGGSTPPPSDTSTASSSSAPQEPDLTQEGNQVDPNKVPQSPMPETQAQVQAAQTAQSAINETMQGTQANRNFANSQQGKSVIATAANYGLVNPDEDGNLSFDSEKLKQLESTIEEGKDGVIESQGTTNSPVAVSNYAGKDIGSSRLSTPADRQAAAKIVSQELESDRAGVPMNGQMPLGRMRELEKAHNQKAKDAFKEGNYTPNPKSLAHKALARGYKNAIRDKIKKEDLPLYDKLSKTSADLTAVKDLKKRVQGKKAPKHNSVWKSILKSGAKYAEIYIGDKLGGPVGAILGSMIGEHLGNAIDRKYGKTIFETKGMKAALDLLNKTKPKAYTKLVDELKKRGVTIPKDETKKPTTQAGLVKLVKKDESKFKGQKGLVDVPDDSGAQKGEREIGKDEVMKAGKRIRFDMKTGKNYVTV